MDTPLPSPREGRTEWTMDEANGHLPELVEAARRIGPQRIVVPDQGVVVTVSAESVVAPKREVTLFELFANSPFAELEGFDETIVKERAPYRGLPTFDD